MPRDDAGRDAGWPELRVRAALTASAAAATVVLLFSPTLGFPWLNWDDQEVFTRNAALHGAGLVKWAFTTTYIGHYQPLAWLTWGAVDRIWGLTPAATHALNIALHAACSALVFAVSFRLRRTVGVAAVAALLFAVHPLRVEVVAWASAMPYSLALLFALLSALAYLKSRGRPLVLALSVALYAISLLARPIALGLPVVLFATAWWLDQGRAPRAREFSRVGMLMPHVVLAAGAAALESMARLTASLADIGVGPRLALAFTAPFRYAWRTVAPFNLTPLDALAIEPRSDIPLMLTSAAGLVAVSWIVWRWRSRYPGAAVAWVSYLALLAPAMGLVPSGLQATADRYTYLPAVPLSIFVAALAARLAWYRGPERSAPRSGRRPTRSVPWLPVAAVITVMAASALLTYRQRGYWQDSVALWTRASEVDPTNDVALYNLASALAEAGRRDDALARYEQVLRIVPDHQDAKRNRDLLRAAALEDAANGFAASGQLEGAIERYRTAIALDPARTHAQSALGMALVQTGRTSEALPHLREAIRLGAPEAAVSNALAFALVEAGRAREACDVLDAARMRFPDDADVRRNRDRLSGECGRR